MMRGNAEYDYDEMIMSEAIPTINLPAVPSQSLSMRSSSPFLVGLERLLEDEQIREQQRRQMLKEKQKHISEQVAKTLHQKEKKLKDLEKEQKKKELAECTFKPNTQHSTNHGKKQQKKGL